MFYCLLGHHRLVCCQTSVWSWQELLHGALQAGVWLFESQSTARAGLSYQTFDRREGLQSTRVQNGVLSGLPVQPRLPADFKAAGVLGGGSCNHASCLYHRDKFFPIDDLKAFLIRYVCTLWIGQLLSDTNMYIHCTLIGGAIENTCIVTVVWLNFHFFIL